jgi:hypothetical protein
MEGLQPSVYILCFSVVSCRLSLVNCRIHAQNKSEYSDYCRLVFRFFISQRGVSGILYFVCTFSVVLVCFSQISFFKHISRFD